MNEIINRERAAGRLRDDLDLGGLSPAIHAHLNINGRYHIHPDRPRSASHQHQRPSYLPLTRAPRFH
jgi:hypothetical protein